MDLESIVSQQKEEVKDLGIWFQILLQTDDFYA